MGSKVYKRVGIRQKGPSLKDWSQLERDIYTRKSDRKLMERSKDRPAWSEREVGDSAAGKATKTGLTVKEWSQLETDIQTSDN